MVYFKNYVLFFLAFFYLSFYAYGLKKFPIKNVKHPYSCEPINIEDEQESELYDLVKEGDIALVDDFLNSGLIDVNEPDWELNIAIKVAINNGFFKIATLLGLRKIENYLFNEDLPDFEDLINEEVITIYYNYASCGSNDCREYILASFSEFLDESMPFFLEGALDTKVLFFKSALSYPFKLKLKEDSMLLRKKINEILTYVIKEFFFHTHNEEVNESIAIFGYNALLTSQHFGPEMTVAYFLLSKKITTIEPDLNPPKVVLNIRQILINTLYEKFKYLDHDCSINRQLYILAAISYFPTLFDSIYFKLMLKKENLFYDFSWEKEQDNFTEEENSALYWLHVNLRNFTSDRASIWPHAYKFFKSKTWKNKVMALTELHNSTLYSFNKIDDHVKKFSQAAIALLFHHWDEIDLISRLNFWHLLNENEYDEVNDFYAAFVIKNTVKNIDELSEEVINFFTDYSKARKNAIIHSKSKRKKNKTKRLIKSYSKRELPRCEKVEPLSFSDQKLNSVDQNLRSLISPRGSPRTYDKKFPNIMHVRFFQGGKKFKVEVVIPPDANKEHIF